MKRAFLTSLVLGAALTLSGCLLPQPDTPIIPPVQPNTGRGPLIGAPAAQPNTRTQPAPEAQPVAAPAPEHQAGMAAPQHPGVVTGHTEDAKATAEAPGQLEGTITGMAAHRVTAMPTWGGEPVEAEVTASGTFAMSLPPGDYGLSFAVSGRDTALLLDTRLRIESGKTRELTFTLSADPLQATLEEEVPLVEPSPSPSVSPSATP